MGRLKWSLLVAAQVAIFVGTFAMFFEYTPWLDAEPLSNLRDIPGSTRSAPSGTVAFSVNHGNYTFYKDAPWTRPRKKWLLRFFFAGSVLLQVSTLLYEYKVFNGYTWKQVFLLDPMKRHPTNRSA